MCVEYCSTACVLVIVAKGVPQFRAVLEVRVLLPTGVGLPLPSKQQAGPNCTCCRGTVQATPPGRTLARIARTRAGKHVYACMHLTHTNETAYSLPLLLELGHPAAHAAAAGGRHRAHHDGRSTAPVRQARQKLPPAGMGPCWPAAAACCSLVRASGHSSWPGGDCDLWPLPLQMRMQATRPAANGGRPHRQGNENATSRKIIGRRGGEQRNVVTSPTPSELCTCTCRARGGPGTHNFKNNAAHVEAKRCGQGVTKS